MPYIKQADRERIRTTGEPTNAGELNYVITLKLIAWDRVQNFNLTEDLSDICKGYLVDLNYQKVNDVTGALMCAIAEFGRRRPDTGEMTRDWISNCIGNVIESIYMNIAAPYEDTKIAANGDVY